MMDPFPRPSFPYRGAPAPVGGGREPSYTHHPVEDLEPLEDVDPLDELTPAQVQACTEGIRQVFLWCFEAQTPLALSHRLFIFTHCFSAGGGQEDETLESFALKAGTTPRGMRALRRGFSAVFEGFALLETVVVTTLLVALRRVADWLREARTAIQLAQRGFIVGYCMYPAAVGGESLESFGEKTGVKRQRMHALRKQFSAIFGVRSPLQK